MTGISFILIAPILFLIWGIYRFICNKYEKNLNITRELFLTLFFIYFLVVVNLTFFKMGALHLSFENRHYANLIPLVETIKMFKYNILGVSNALYNVIGNVLLFVPLGFAIPLFYNKKNNFFRVTAYGFIASLTIEVLQYFTYINTTDIDDIIFNTLGAILGFICFNFAYKAFKKTNVIKLFDNISNDTDKSLLLISSKPIITMLIAVSLLSFGVLYSTTSSGLLKTDQLAKEVFNNYDNFEYVEATDFFDYKLFLYDFDDYLELRTAEKVLNNRWVDGSIHQINFTDENYGYSVMIVDNDKSKGIVVYGRNNDASMIQITFNGKKYAEPLQSNTYFMVTFPTFEEISKDSDIFKFYSTGESNVLDVAFIEENGNECTHMKLIK